MRRVTLSITGGGAKIVHIVEIPDPIAEATKFTAHAQYHVTCT